MWSPFLGAFFRMTGLCRRCRITVPLLMINGRYDYFFPLESSRNSMFRFWGRKTTNVLPSSTPDTSLLTTR